MIFAYDHREIITTDRVPCETSVTAALLSWLDAKIAQKNAWKPIWLVRGWATSFARQCTPAPGEGCDRFAKSKYEWEPLLHAPYSSDMSPPDFYLFRKLQESMRGHRFPSVKEVSAAVNRAIRELKKSGTLDGIANLPKHWNVVVEKQGDYTEGM